MTRSLSHILLVTVIVSTVSCAFFVFAGNAHAQPATTGSQNFVPLEKLDGTRLSGIYNTDTSSSFAFSNLLSNFFSIALSIGAILAVLRLVYAGYKYMTSESVGSIGQAKEILGDTVIGLLILMSIWLILNQINPCLLRLDILRSLQGSGSECRPDTYSTTSSGGLGNFDSGTGTGAF